MKVCVHFEHMSDGVNSEIGGVGATTGVGGDGQGGAMFDVAAGDGVKEGDKSPYPYQADLVFFGGLADKYGKNIDDDTKLRQLASREILSGKVITSPFLTPEVKIKYPPTMDDDALSVNIYIMDNESMDAVLLWGQPAVARTEDVEDKLALYDLRAKLVSSRYLRMKAWQIIAPYLITSQVDADTELPGESQISRSILRENAPIDIITSKIQSLFATT